MRSGRRPTQRPRSLPGSALLTLRERGEGRAGRRGGVAAARVRGRGLRGGAPLRPGLSDFSQDAGKELGGLRRGVCRTSFAPLGPGQRRTVRAGTVGTAVRRRHAKDYASLGPAQAHCERAGVVRRDPAVWSPHLSVSHPPNLSLLGPSPLKVGSREVCEGLAATHLTELFSIP